MLKGIVSSGTRLRWPEGASTTSTAAGRSGITQLVRREFFGRVLRELRLAIGTVSTHLRSRRHDLEAQAAFHLPAHLLQRLAEKFFDLAAAQANEVSVLLLEAALVVMLVAFKVQQIEFVDQAAGFQKLERR